MSNELVLEVNSLDIVVLEVVELAEVVLEEALRLVEIFP